MISQELPLYQHRSKQDSGEEADEVTDNVLRELHVEVNQVIVDRGTLVRDFDSDSWAAGVWRPLTFPCVSPESRVYQ